MKEKYKSLSLFEFHSRFKTSEDCLLYLTKWKWGNGFGCRKSEHKHSCQGSHFRELHRVIMNLKARLRGVHHRVEGLHDYLDEYCYRFNRSFVKENIFDNLLIRMVKVKPCYIKNIGQ